jgi:hypothetical protein
MKKAYLQFWELSEINHEVKSDGVTLHLTINDCKNYISNFYKKRIGKKVPNKYSRIVGEPIIVEISENLFSLINKNINLKIKNYNYNNLLKLEEIIII